MYCLSCGNSLPEKALFCAKCGKLTSRGMGESSKESEDVATLAANFHPSDPYSPRPSTSYGPPVPSGWTQNPYVPPSPYAPLAPPSPLPPPQHRRSSPGFLKGLFIGMLVILVLGSIGGWLFLKQGAPSPKATPHPSVQSTRPTATMTAQASPTAQAASVLYTADWSSGLNG
jgi:hypothetical protein